MDTITPLHQDPLHGDTSETPLQEPQRACPRNSPCQLQGCMICCTPTNHVRNLDKALSSNDTSRTSPTTINLPQPPPNHTILILTNAFKNAIRENWIYTLNALYKQFIIQMETNLEFFIHEQYDL